MYYCGFVFFSPISFAIWIYDNVAVGLVTYVLFGDCSSRMIQLRDNSIIRLSRIIGRCGFLLRNGRSGDIEAHSLKRKHWKFGLGEEEELRMTVVFRNNFKQRVFESKTMFFLS